METQKVEQTGNFDWEANESNLPFQQHMIAGCMAGLIEHVSMLPLDNIKTHLQVSKKESISDVAKHIYNEGGIFSFYNGFKVVASGTMPAHAAYFSVYEIAKKKFGIDDDNLHPYLFGLTGCLATFFHDLILTPLDVIKQRQQLSRQQSSEIIQQIKANEGLKSFLRSFKVTYFMNAPSAALIVMVNESLKTLSFGKDQHNFASHLVCAGIAGGISAFFTNPLDVVKTRLQTQKDNMHFRNQKISSQKAQTNKNLNPKPQYSNSTLNSEAKRQIKYQNAKDTIAKIMQEDGLMGFMRGVSTRMVMVAPCTAISWASYEQIKKFLSNQSRKY